MNAAALLLVGALVAVRAVAGAAPPTGQDAAPARCLKGSDLVSCLAALARQPNDPGLLVAEGDALVDLKRPGEAIGVYRNALRSGAGEEVIAARIAAAREQRRSLLEECRRETGPSAERACASAWLPGAPDEVTLFKRRGELLQNDNQPAASLDAYMAAARLSPRDRDVARAIIALCGGIERPDAAMLTARGAAEMRLGRAADAVVSLRAALRLAPDSQEAEVRLRAAESTLASQRRTAAGMAAPAPRAADGPSGGAYSNEAPVTRSN